MRRHNSEGISHRGTENTETGNTEKPGARFFSVFPVSVFSVPLWLILFALCTTLVAADGKAPLECASCHRQQAQSQPSTGMAHALQSAATAPILAAHAKLNFRQGPYTYAIERRGDQSIYRVTSGSGAAPKSFLLPSSGLLGSARPARPTC